MDRPTEGTPRPLTEPDPERPDRIARRRAAVVDSRSEEPAVDEPEPSADDGSGGTERIARALVTELREARRIEKTLADLSDRVAALGPGRSAGAPRSDRRAAGSIGLAVLGGLVAAGLVHVGLGFHLMGLESDVAAIARSTDAMAGRIEAARAADAAERAAIEERAAGRLEDEAGQRAAERAAATTERARLERRLGEREGQLEAVAAERTALAGRIETLEGQLADERAWVRRLARSPAAGAGEPDPDRPVVPAGPDPDPVDPPDAVEPVEERPFLSRLNAVLAHCDGERLYRVLSAQAVENGALRMPVLKVFGGEGDSVEEIRARRLTVVVDRRARHAAITLHGAERRRDRDDGRIDLVSLPEFQVDLFDIEPERWQDIEEIVEWADR